MKNASFSGILVFSWFISLGNLLIQYAVYHRLEFLGYNFWIRYSLILPPLGSLWSPLIFVFTNFLLQYYHSRPPSTYFKWTISHFLKISAGVLTGIFLIIENSIGEYYTIWLYPLSLWTHFILVRAIFTYQESENNSSETQIQNENRKSGNQNSFHWKTENGWINIRQPFQGILLVGGPGSGKTYSIVQEIIHQSIQKEYTGFIYDFKYPELTEFTHGCLMHHKAKAVQFYTVNFTDPSKSHRINPLHPNNLPISLFANEYAGIILKNLKKEWVGKQDFWADNAIAYFKSIIWYLKKHEPQYCTLPHALALALLDYPLVLELLSKDQECRTMISSLWTAYKENASAQIAGCISSLQNPLDKLNNPNIFWVLTGNEVPMALNDPNFPSLLCIGNSFSLSDSLNPVISLIASVVMKNCNVRGRRKSIFLLDEAPTLYIPNLKDLPNTGRSNLISTIYCCQDFSQMDFQYGKEESKMIRSSLGNQFYGMVNDYETAFQISQIFGKEDYTMGHKNSSTSYSNLSEPNSSFGISYSSREKEILKPNAALGFKTGYFVGKMTGGKFPNFCGKPIIVHRPLSEPTPELRNFTLSSNTDPIGKEDLLKSLEPNLRPYEQISFQAVIEWNYRKVFYEAEEFLFRNNQ